MRTAVYIRVSTDDQAKEGFSIPAQREKLISYIHSQGWELFDIYADEGISAKNTDRPQLARLLMDVRLGHIDVVLVYRLDRLTRSVLDLYQLLQEFEKHGVHFKSSTEVYDTTTAIGRLFITLVAALAQWERENLAERVKMGMGQMVRQRKRPGGPAPYGYDLVNGRLAVNDAEAGIVRLMFAQYAKGRSPRKIAEEANLLGARGKNGARWSASAVLRLLKNPVYSGALRWNYADSWQRQNPPDEWLVEEAVHTPIIDPVLFSYVQKQAADRSHHHPRVLSSSFLFSGLLICSRCGSPMRGKTASTTSSSGKRYTNSYYVCKSKLTGTCDAPAIREDLLEQQVIGHLSHYEAEAREAAKEALARLAPEHVSLRMDEQQLARKRDLKRKRWEAAYEDGLITLGALREKIRELESLETAVASSIHIPPHTTISNEQAGSHLLSDWKLIWSAASREERRQLATCLIKRMEAQTEGTTGSRRAVRLVSLEFH